MFSSSFWSHPLVIAAGYFSVVTLFLIVALAIFQLVTRYDDMKEIQKGNLAVGFATGGKILGVANIFRYSIEHHNSLPQMLGWGGFGFLLLLIAYFTFEFLTPAFRIDEEIGRDNRAVGFLSFCISVGLSFVIGASIK